MCPPITWVPGGASVDPPTRVNALMRFSHPGPPTTSPMITNHPPIRNQTSSSQPTPRSSVGACLPSTPAGARREDVRVPAPRPLDGTPVPAHRHPQSQSLPFAQHEVFPKINIPHARGRPHLLSSLSVPHVDAHFKTYVNALTVSGARNVLLVAARTAHRTPFAWAGLPVAVGRKSSHTHPTRACRACRAPPTCVAPRHVTCNATSSLPT